MMTYKSDITNLEDTRERINNAARLFNRVIEGVLLDNKYPEGFEIYLHKISNELEDSISDFNYEAKINIRELYQQCNIPFEEEYEWQLSPWELSPQISELGRPQ